MIGSDQPPLWLGVIFIVILVVGGAWAFLLTTETNLHRQGYVKDKKTKKWIYRGSS